MKNRVGRKKEFIEKNTLVIQTVHGMDEMKSMFINGDLKRLSSPTCRVPALDSARVNRPLNRLSPAKRTDIDARVTSQPCFPEREAGAVAFASRAQDIAPDLRLSDRTAHVVTRLWSKPQLEQIFSHTQKESNVEGLSGWHGGLA